MIIKKTLYVHAHFTHDGKFTSWFTSDFKVTGTGSDSLHGGFFVFMHEVTVSFTNPYTEQDAALAAANGIDTVIEAKKAEHQKFLRDMAFLKNKLLALPAPEIIDADPQPVRLEDPSSPDIPF